jgi:hypoxanthine phosphoribosyltransferase
MKSYDYQHRDGLEPISWDRFAELTRVLTEKLASEKIELILGIARAGLFPATLVSCALRRELYPVRVTRRIDDEVKFEKPVWRVDVPETVRGRRVAVLDEISDSGETLALVAARARERGAVHVVTGCLVSHTWADPKPDYAAAISDALVIFPWDEKAYLNGHWQTPPEITAALNFQDQPSNE